MKDLDFHRIGQQIRKRRLECSVDFFIEHEYTYPRNRTHRNTIDNEISKRLRSCDYATKEKILKIIDIL